MNIKSIDNLNFLGKNELSNYTACLKGGAIGDALGNPVEFYNIKSIRNIYGKDGIKDLYINSKGVAEITDDTQMTMFTADGILKSLQKTLDKTKFPDLKTIFDSYRLWFNTQTQSQKIQEGKGWIAELKELYAMRAPGTTCMGSMSKDIPGTIENPTNSSSGCGGVMRVAPAGLVYYKDPEMAFKVGADCAALTHGNPKGYLSAGFLSGMIAHIIGGKNISEAVDATLPILEQYKSHEPVTRLINKAKELAQTDIEPLTAIEELGEGWVGDEAIAISTYCALKEPDNFEKAVKMAVNHSGDSDSTGAILGNILGAHLGMDKIPKKWANKTELSKELEILANDLFIDPKEIKDAKIRYPI